MSKKFLNEYNLNNHFKNKRVLITGSTRGIGLDISKTFSNLGANVLGFGSKDFDLSESESIKKFELYIKKLKKIDILINNAGVYGPKGYLEKVSWNEWVKTIEINLLT